MAQNPKEAAKEREFQIAAKRTREAYDKLNGIAGRGGIELGYLRAKERYDERNNGKYRDPKRIEEEYFRIKENYDKVSKEYQSAQNEKNRLRRELNQIKEKSSAADSVKGVEKDIKEARAEREKAVLLSPSRGNQAVEAADERIRLLEERLSSSKEKVTGTKEDRFVDATEDRFSGFTLTDGIVTQPSNDPAKPTQVIFVDTIDNSGKNTTTAFTSRAAARDAFLKNYATRGQVESLKAQLLASNYIKQKDIDEGTWDQGLDDLLIARTAKLVSDVKYSFGEPITVEQFLATKKSSGTGGSKTYRSMSTRGDARQQINDYLTDLTGSGATEEEYEEYYKILNAEERRQTMTTTDGTTIGDVMTDAERMVIAAKVARKRLKNTDVDALLSSSKGSRVSIDIAALQELASDYGIDMTAAEALKQVTLGIGQKNYLEKQQERLRLIAKKMHPGLADHIDAGGTVLDIANTYARAKFSKLGVVIKSPTKDKDVMDAVASGKSIAEFNKEMQANPMWRFTDEARETTSDFLTTIGRMWGRG